MRDDRHQAPDEDIGRESAWQGLLWPALSIAGGMVAYFLISGLVVDPLNPPAKALDPPAFSFLWESTPPPPPQVVLAADLNARYAVAIPSVLLTIAFIATAVVAFFHILPLFGRMAVACGAVSIPVGAFAGNLEQYNNSTRASVANCAPSSGQDHCPLDQAVARAGDLGTFDAPALNQILTVITWNSMLSSAGIFLMAMCFLFIARRATGNELSPDNLRTRKRAFLVAMVMSGLMLVFSVATANGYYEMGPSLMAVDDAPAMHALAQAGSSYWGAVYTTVIVVIGTSPALSVLVDIRRRGQVACLGADYAEYRAWRDKHGLRV